MPQLGETVAEGKIVKWFKTAGDVVKPGDNLFEIETDKTSMEVPATSAGTLTDIRFQVGETAKVGDVVAIIADGSSSAARAAAPPAAPQQISLAPIAAALREVAQPARNKPRSEPLDPFREVRTPDRNFGPAKLPTGAFVTPLARRLASERGIDLTRLSGSGPHGRIVAADIDRAPPSGRSLAVGATAGQVKTLFEKAEYEEVPLDSMRRAIATRMIEAKQ